MSEFDIIIIDCLKKSGFMCICFESQTKPKCSLFKYFKIKENNELK